MQLNVLIKHGCVKPGDEIDVSIYPANEDTVLGSYTGKVTFVGELAGDEGLDFVAIQDQGMPDYLRH